ICALTAMEQILGSPSVPLYRGSPGSDRRPFKVLSRRSSSHRYRRLHGLAPVPVVLEEVERLPLGGVLPDEVLVQRDPQAGALRQREVAVFHLGVSGAARGLLDPGIDEVVEVLLDLE